MIKIFWNAYVVGTRKRPRIRLGEKFRIGKWVGVCWMNLLGVIVMGHAKDSLNPEWWKTLRKENYSWK